MKLNWIILVFSISEDKGQGGIVPFCAMSCLRELLAYAYNVEDAIKSKHTVNFTDQNMQDWQLVNTFQRYA